MSSLKSSHIRTMWALATTTLVVSVCLALPSLSRADTGGQSVAYQVDAAHDGYQPDSQITLPLYEQWTVDLSGDVSYPVIVNGTVYVTAGETLYAIGLGSGATLWRRALGGTYAVPGVTYDAGQLYVVNSSGELSAFDPGTGDVIWTTQLPGQEIFDSAPTAGDGDVYVAGSEVTGTLYAVSEANGSIAWSQPVENGQGSSPAVGPGGVYVAYDCDQDFGFDPATGVLLWHNNTSCEGGGGTTPMLADNDLFGIDGVLGSVILGGGAGQWIGTFASDTTPAAANGVLYALSDGVLSALQDDGLGPPVWGFSGDGQLDTAPLVAGDLVFEGSASGDLYAIDAATGAEEWSANVGQGIDCPGSTGSTGLAVADQAVIVPAGDYLTAYGENALSGLVDSGSYVAGSSCGVGGVAGDGGNGGAGSDNSDGGSVTSAGVGDGLKASIRVPVDSVRPSLPKRVHVRESVKVKRGKWSPKPAGYTYRWLLCNRRGRKCRVLKRAHRRSFRIIKRDVGYRLRVRVRARDAGGLSAKVTSAPSGRVRRRKS